FAWVTPHVRQVGAHGGEPLVVVTGHLGEETAFAVHDLVVADRQDVVLAERIHEGEGHLALVVATVERVALDVFQGVVHPPHVPFEAEAESGVVGRRGDPGEARGLLGDHEDPGVAAIGRGVHLLEEADRLQVLSTAVHVRLPFAVATRVIQIEHRGNGIHAQSVDMEFLEPVEGVRDEEVPHLGAPVVEDQRPPVLVLAASRIRVLVDGFPVETREGEGVLREVAGNPVQDDPDARLMETVDEIAEVVRLAVPVGRGVIAADLIAPGAAEGVLGYGHELHVREAGRVDMSDELVRKGPVAQAWFPGAEVHLVHREGLGDRMRGSSSCHPGPVAPPVVGAGDDRGGRRRRLRESRH
ncbi:hypothetical protein ABE10_02110, partial [Bacillus toyonensis]|nr:hypothetical protein [Bacillus toyonensis]